MVCKPSDPCYRWGGKLASMSDVIAEAARARDEDVSKLTPQQIRARNFIQDHVPRAPPITGLPGQTWNLLRQTAILMTTIESSGYFDRSPEVQRYEESVLGNWSPGGMLL
jgi:hypothetical protein